MLLGFVNVTIGRNSHARKMISQEFKILIDDGQHTDLWEDDWIGRGKLYVCFSRIFALSCAKSGRVSEFGCWVEDRRK